MIAEGKMNYLIRWPCVISVLFIGVMLGGCAATVPVMPEQYDVEAEKFLPPQGKGNIYVVREDVFKGSGVVFKIDLDGKSCGSVAPGTYHLFELQPGQHVVSVSTQENADHKIVMVAEGMNYFVEILPKMGWMAARVSVERIDEKRGRQLVIDGKRAETLPVK